MVEDVIVDACASKDMAPRALLRSFIIDLSDQHTEGLFSAADWMEIQASVVALPAKRLTFVERLCSVRTLAEFDAAIVAIRNDRVPASTDDAWLFMVMDKM